MLDGSSIKNLHTYFENDKLKKKYICAENENVQFFDIKELPKIKKKQLSLITKVISILEDKLPIKSNITLDYLGPNLNSFKKIS